MEKQQGPRTTAKACQFCRRRKIRCDALKPTCTTCRSSNRTCVYHHAPAKPRPSTALVNSIKEEKNELERMLIRLKLGTPAVREALLESVDLVDGKVSLKRLNLSSSPAAGPEGRSEGSYQTPTGSVFRDTLPSDQLSSSGDDNDDDDDDDDGGEVSGALSADGGDRLGIFGPTTAFHNGILKTPTSPTPWTTSQPLGYQLIANAALGRQQEHQLRNLTTIRGVPAELALHLLDLHWNRQHHTFLLTYRPAFMRELVDGGPYCSDFLLNAVFACASKFSERIEVRSDPADPESAGRGFFRRCEELIARDSIMNQSCIPTIIGLLMLGTTYNARGSTSKGWLYTGYALRMVYDLGLHLDSQEAGASPEDVEIRRRVFWGAFIGEKLQSIYLGRPVTIQLRDAQVPCEFMDTFEEFEPWTPYIDPKSSAVMPIATKPWTALTYSVSVFQQLCRLAKILTVIINKIYFVGATTRKTHAALKQIDEALASWYRDLPPHLVYEPWTRDPGDPATTAAPNLTILHTTYNCLIILLHRPFISGSDLLNGSVSTNSWKRCTTAARNITYLALAYRSSYPLRQSNYTFSYAVYVACTIHVHNAAAMGSNAPESDSSMLRASLRCLDELAIPNSGVADTARIIRKLMEAKGIPEFTVTLEPQQMSTPPFLDNSWQLPSSSPNFDDLPQLESFSAFGLSGHDLLFGFMENNFSPSDYLGDVDPGH